jgi:hypothetical protein
LHDWLLAVQSLQVLPRLPQVVSLFFMHVPFWQQPVRQLLALQLPPLELPLDDPDDDPLEDPEELPLEDPEDDPLDEPLEDPDDEPLDDPEEPPLDDPVQDPPVHT